MKPCLACEAALNGRCAVDTANQPTVTEYTADGLWVAHIVIPDSGSIVPQHVHKFDHMTVLARGSLTAFREDGQPPERVSAPHVLTIPAGVAHAFETHEPNTTILCVHNIARSGRVEITARNELNFAGED